MFFIFFALLSILHAAEIVEWSKIYGEISNLYASFNRRYPRGVKRLYKMIGESDFKGHVYYQIGGFPNMAEGDLVLAHVPFAFKVSFFKEVKKKGYQKVLWLDASVLPAVSLNDIFDMIEKDGIFVESNYSGHSVGEYSNEKAVAAMGVPLQVAHGIRSCSAAVVGINFRNPRALKLFDSWYQAAHDPHAFFSARSDQNVLSILLWREKFLNWADYDNFFIIDRYFVY